MKRKFVCCAINRLIMMPHVIKSQNCVTDIKNWPLVALCFSHVIYHSLMNLYQQDHHSTQLIHSMR